MRKIFHIYHELKIFAIISLTSGSLIFLSSLLGHFIRRGNLIPYATVGGFIGILSGISFLFRKSFLRKENVIAVAVCSLISFGVTSLISVFNFDKPFLILFSFLLMGFTTTFSNWYFQQYKYISNSLRYGLLGIILILPTFYFIISSILKFKFGINDPYSIIDSLLQHPNGQANLNAVSPFIFGGGLALAFFINIIVQMELIKSKASMFMFKLIWKNLLPLNFAVMLLSCSLGSVILTYLILEN